MVPHQSDHQACELRFANLSTSRERAAAEVKKASEHDDLMVFEGHPFECSILVLEKSLSAEHLCDSTFRIHAVVFLQG